MAVEVNIPQEFQVSCFSILVIFLSAFRLSLPFFLPLDARAGHVFHSYKAHFVRTTSREINKSFKRSELGPRLVGFIVLCSWAGHLTLTVPFSTQGYESRTAQHYGNVTK